MEEFDIFEIIKIAHIIAVVAWFAGLFYLPRLFVYHSEVALGSEADKLFIKMEHRLLRYIMNPAMIAVFVFGFYLANQIGFNFAWLHIKITLVLILAIYHHFLAHCRKQFAAGNNKHNAKFYRIINEIPTILLIAIVSLVILKPFS